MTGALSAARRAAWALPLALATMVAGARVAHAQTCMAGYPGSCSVSGSATITIAKVMSFSLSTASTTAPTPTYGDYLQGYNETSGPVITVSANTPWAVSVSAGAPLWSAQALAGATPRLDKPAADLLWTLTPGSGFAPLSVLAAPVASGTATPTTTIPLHYRILYALDQDAPGTYAMDLVVTVVTP